MKNDTREILCKLIAEHGQALCDDPVQCEGLLRDHCPHDPGGVNVLIYALNEGLESGILSIDPFLLLQGRLVKRLEDHHGMREDMALWAVETWALALGIIRQNELLPTQKIVRCDLRDYKFCEPDYEQILLWAGALKLEPRTIVERLLIESAGDYGGYESSEFTDGRIISLNWDTDMLPLRKFEWVDGLILKRIRFDGQFSELPGPGSLSLTLPNLESLDCGGMNFHRLALSSVPLLRELHCYSNELIELDLSNVPLLEALDCSHNQLTELNLSNVPWLYRLFCHDNQLTELDLSNVPLLGNLSCGSNQLTELNLSDVTHLNYLDVCGNQLIELDLSNVPWLYKLYCENNQLTELDLSLAPMLRTLNCSNNQVTELDIRPLKKLTCLFYDKYKTRLIQRLDQNFA